MRARRWLDRLGFVGLSGGVLLSGFFRGIYALTLRIEVTFGVLVVVLLEATLSSVVFSAFVLISAALFLYQLEFRREEDVSIERGTLTAVVPVCGDADVLEVSVESLLESKYADLEVVIVTEPGDGTSERRAVELADEHARVSHLVNARYPGSKAGAINYAAEATESAFVGVFDADEAVDPEFLPRAAALLEGHDVVQGRTVPQPSGLVESVAYYESILLSYVARRLLYLVTDFRMAASRAIVMRREAFEAVGGYDAEMLTEDFDFAYRCYRERLDVVEHLSNPSRIDAAHSIRDWWGQRKRWMTGYAQVFHRLLTSIDPTDYRSIVSAFICGGTVIGPPLLLSVLSKFAVLLVVSAPEVVRLSLLSEYSIHYVVSSRQVFVLPVTAVFVATAGAHLHDYRVGSVDDLDWYWVLVPLLFPLYGLAALRAVFEYVTSRGLEWYAVEKDPEKIRY